MFTYVVPRHRRNPRHPVGEIARWTDQTDYYPAAFRDAVESTGVDDDSALI